MISGWVSVGTTSAEPPAPRTNSASHSAARPTSSERAGSALTLGIATSSASSSNHGSATAASLCRGGVARGRELAAGRFDVPAAREPHGRGHAGAVEHRLEGVDRAA